MASKSLVEVPNIGPQRTSTFAVVAGQRGQPMALNMRTLNDADKTILRTRAICKLESDRLTYCVGGPGEPRPNDFTTTAGDGNTRVVLKRATTPAQK